MGRSLRVSLLGALAVAAAAVATLLYRFDPARFGFYPRCPLFVLTGLYCPGCGALRATHQFLHADLAGALGYNPLFVLMAPALAYAVAARVLAPAGVHLPVPRLSGRATWAVACVVIGFGVLRNLPFAPFSTLAP